MNIYALLHAVHLGYYGWGSADTWRGVVAHPRVYRPTLTRPGCEITHSAVDRHPGRDDATPERVCGTTFTLGPWGSPAKGQYGCPPPQYVLGRSPNYRRIRFGRSINEGWGFYIDA